MEKQKKPAAKDMDEPEEFPPEEPPSLPPVKSLNEQKMLGKKKRKTKEGGDEPQQKVRAGDSSKHEELADCPATDVTFRAPNEEQDDVGEEEQVRYPGAVHVKGGNEAGRHSEISTSTLASNAPTPQRGIDDVPLFEAERVDSLRITDALAVYHDPHQARRRCFLAFGAVVLLAVVLMIVLAVTLTPKLPAPVTLFGAGYFLDSTVSLMHTQDGSTRSIPTVIGLLMRLTLLALDLNSIPSEIGQLTQLTHMWLHGNTLIGSIPSEVGQLTQLRYLYLNNNTLTGFILPEIGQLTQLSKLQLYSNSLTGFIPSSLCTVENLSFIVDCEESTCDCCECGRLHPSK